MATNFPSGLDSFTNPSATDSMDSVSVPHASQHANLNDAVEALEAKVGVDGSAVTSSLDYLVRSAMPVGSVIPFAGASSPDATWLVCDGSAISRTTYAALFAVLGTTYGAGDGSTTFNIPNMGGRVPVGLDSGQTEFDALGETGGAKTHTLTTAEMPSHTHTQNAHTHTQNAHTHTQNAHTHTQNPHSHSMSTKFSGNDVGVTTSVKRVDYQNNRYADSASFTFSIDNTTATNQNATATNQNTTATNQNTTATNQNTGGGAAHNNLQPYMALNYIMKAA